MLSTFSLVAKNTRTKFVVGTGESKDGAKWYKTLSIQMKKIVRFVRKEAIFWEKIVGTWIKFFNKNNTRLPLWLSSGSAIGLVYFYSSNFGAPDSRETSQAVALFEKY